MSYDQQGEPLVRVVKGNASPEELAALVTAIATVRKAAGESPRPPEGLSAWGAYWHKQRLVPRPGQDGWRASALPR